MIPYGKQEISEQDKLAVLGVLASDFLTQGPKVPEFEEQVAARVRAKYGVAMNSATSALHAACLALGVGPKDVVWTSAISFVASANCAIYCGAEVEFVDVEPETGNICTRDLEKRLIGAKLKGRLPKVVIPVHFAGQPADMARIGELATEFGFQVIEDASHALGAEHEGNPVGGCENSDITVFSFHPVKMITTGEGGLATTNSSELYSRLQRIRSHGITRDPNSVESEFEGDWFYDQVEIGYNYRMTDIYAALGSSQLKQLDEFLARRREIATKYSELLEHTPHSPLAQISGRMSSWHLFVIKVDSANNRKVIFDKLRQEGVLVNVHYRPIYRQAYYARMEKYKVESFPGAEEFYSRIISLPIFPSLTDNEISKVVQCLRSAPGYQTIF